MSKLKAPSAAPTAEQLFAAAVSRRRERCTALTTYSHASLSAYLSAHLPASWRVEVPAPSQPGISAFPTAHAQPATHAQELQHLATFLTGIPVAEAEDQYNGHCETCAVYFTQHVAASLGSASSSSSSSSSSILASTYANLTTRLAQLPWAGQVEDIFAAERRARLDAKLAAALQQGRTAAMWAPLLEGGMASAPASEGASAAPVPTAMGTVASRAFEHLAGAPGFPARLAEAVAAASSAHAPRKVVLPCYILSA